MRKYFDNDDIRFFKLLAGLSIVFVAFAAAI